jgi:3-hydroxy-9,10-secoandrosta-1,3,5(10)-triene-9,17-dione monooxygenase
MSVTATATSTPHPTPTSLSGVTPEGLVARAEAIAPGLVPMQAETEARTFYSQATHEAFKEAGFYRILTPKRYGGLEFGIDTFLKVAMTIASGCPSTGWQLCLGTSHALTAASFFPEPVQAELFAESDFICPTTIRPGGVIEKRPDGDWNLTGEFPYASGSPYGQYYMGHTLLPEPAPQGPPAPMLFIAPRSQWTRLDDWGAQLGMKGSGSHTVRFENGVIPDRFVMPGTSLMEMDVSGGTPGLDLHGNPLYAGSSYSFFLLEAAAVCTGIAKNGLAAFEELMAKTTSFPPIVPRTQDADFQRWYGIGAGKVIAAEALMTACAQEWMDIAARGAFDRYQDMRLVAMSREVLDLCWEATHDVFFRVAGSGSVLAGSRMERIWRDMSTLRSHSGFVFFIEFSKRELAKARFDVS